MEELLQELADAELGKQVMVTVGVAGTTNACTIFSFLENSRAHTMHLGEKK